MLSPVSSFTRLVYRIRVPAAHFSDAGKYVLPKSKWSVKTLNLLNGSDNDVIQVDTVERLADLACVDLNHIACPHVNNSLTKEMICKDVNVILKCAQSLKDCPLNVHMAAANSVQSTHLSALRQDVVVHNTSLLKRKKDLFLNLDEKHVLTRDNGDRLYKVSTSFKSLQQDA